MEWKLTLAVVVCCSVWVQRKLKISQKPEIFCFWLNCTRSGWKSFIFLWIDWLWNGCADCMNFQLKGNFKLIFFSWKFFRRELFFSLFLWNFVKILLFWTLRLSWGYQCLRKLLLKFPKIRVSDIFVLCNEICMIFSSNIS